MGKSKVEKVDRIRGISADVMVIDEVSYFDWERAIDEIYMLVFGRSLEAGPLKVKQDYKEKRDCE